MNTPREIEIVIEAITAIDWWHGVSEDDRPSPDQRLRSDLSLSSVQLGALCLALHAEMSPSSKALLTHCAERAYLQDATLRALAEALASVTRDRAQAPAPSRRYR